MDAGKTRDHQRELMFFIDSKGSRLCRSSNTMVHSQRYGSTRSFNSNGEKSIQKSRMTARTKYGKTSNIPICKGVLQVCIYNLSTLLLNIYVEIIMLDVLEKWDKDISIGGRKGTNLRYPDDTTLIAGTKDDIAEIITKVKRASEESGLYLNVKKTKVMTIGNW